MYLEIPDLQVRIPKGRVASTAAASFLLNVLDFFDNTLIIHGKLKSCLLLRAFLLVRGLGPSSRLIFFFSACKKEREVIF